MDVMERYFIIIVNGVVIATSNTTSDSGMLTLLEQYTAPTALHI